MKSKQRARAESARKRPASARRSALDRLSRFPCPRQQFIEAVDRVSVDHAREHVLEIGVGLDVVKLAGLCRPPNYAAWACFPQDSR
jgi:hypothetical protein